MNLNHLLVGNPRIRPHVKGVVRAESVARRYRPIKDSIQFNINHCIFYWSLLLYDFNGDHILFALSIFIQVPVTHCQDLVNKSIDGDVLYPFVPVVLTLFSYST